MIKNFIALNKFLNMMSFLYRILMMNYDKLRYILVCFMVYFRWYLEAY